MNEQQDKVDATLVIQGYRKKLAATEEQCIMLQAKLQQLQDEKSQQNKGEDK